MTTIGDQFRNDPRVEEARRLLLEALDEHRVQLTEPKKGRDELAASYQQLVERAGDVRGRPLYFPYLGSGMGNGALVELADGSVKYDFISGIGVHAWGHSHPDLVRAGFDAAMADTIMQGNLQLNIESTDVAASLLRMAKADGGNLDNCFLTTSGAMANENALKIAFQARAPADRILAFEGCFAGRSIALSHVTDRPEYRVGVPDAIAVDYVPFFDHQNPTESRRRALDVLKGYLETGGEAYGLMMFELVQGEGGAYPGERDFFVSLMEELKQAGIPVVVDEIQTFGRTTAPFAFQHFDLASYVDLVTVGKTLQVCATLYSDALNPKPGLLSQTFTGSTASLFAAREILRTMEKGDLFGAKGRIAELHAHFVHRLSALEAREPDLITGPYGIGAMVGFTPLSGDAERVKPFVMELYHAGLITFMAGKNPVRVRMLLPYAVLTNADIDAAVDIIESTLKTVA